MEAQSDKTTFSDFISRLWLVVDEVLLLDCGDVCVCGGPLAFLKSEVVEAGLALDKFGNWTPVWSGEIFHFHLSVDLELIESPVQKWICQIHFPCFRFRSREFHEFS